MPSLLNSTGIDGTVNTGVAANYLKTKPTTQLGTRALVFLNITLSGSGAPDLTKQTGSSGTYTDPQSYLTTLVRTVQGSAEIYAIGTPTATDITIAIASNTANDSADGSQVSDGSWGDIEVAVWTALGSWNSPIGTNVVASAKSLSGATLV